MRKRFDRENPNKTIEDIIVEIRDKHKDFGYRRIYEELIKLGFKINKKKVQRLFQVKTYTRKNRKYSSYKGVIGKIEKNGVRRRFHTNIAHQKITTDTTEFKYYKINKSSKMITKKLYLDLFLDIFNDDILSYSINKRYYVHVKAGYTGYKQL